MKALDLSRSPSNVLGRFPITLRSAAIGIGMRWLAGITGPCSGGPGGPPPPPPPPPPPGGPPPRGAFRRRAAAKATLSRSPASGAALEEVEIAGVGPVGVEGAVEVEVSPGAIVVCVAVVVVPMTLLDVGG